jgi:outer membrane protein OmpA-like peptidoglycan-associated protein/tetratricopeptide (TPR) repeat protein
MVFTNRLNWLAFAMVFFLQISYAQDKKASAYFERGKQDFLNRDFSNAVVNFNKYFERDSSIVEAYFKMGQIFEIKKEYPKATDFYKKLIQKAPDKIEYIQAYTFLGTRAIEKLEYQKAKEYLSVSLKNTNPKSFIYNQIQKQLKTCDFGISIMANPLKISPKSIDGDLNFLDKQYFPVLTADNSTIYYTARNDNTDENIYFSTQKEGKWDKPKPLSPRINTQFNEGTCTVSGDGNVMVFTSCEGRESLGSCDLYICYKQDKDWTVPVNLGKNINSKFWDSQPSLSSDGHTLYFVSDRIGSIGKKDIWKSTQDENKQWLPAQNLGKGINTEYDEISPFIHANNQTLFFASNGHLGIGGFDIFLTNAFGTDISQVTNLGYPINTANDELSMFVSSDGKRALYSFDRNQKILLYEFEVPEELVHKFKTTFVLKGEIKDKKSKEFIATEIELVDVQENKVISKFSSSSKDGSYTVVLPKGGSFAVFVNKEGYLYKSLNFNVNEGQNQENVLKLDIELEKIEKNVREVLNNIFFDTGLAVFRPESYIELFRLTEILKQNPQLKVEISGHTDNIGNDKDNLNLSQLRADAVVNYLINNGIEKNKVVAIGYGKTKPITDNNSEFNRQQNRRIEIKFY